MFPQRGKQRVSMQRGHAMHGRSELLPNSGRLLRPEHRQQQLRGLWQGLWRRSSLLRRQLRRHCHGFGKLRRLRHGLYYGPELLRRPLCVHVGWLMRRRDAGHMQWRSVHVRRSWRAVRSEPALRCHRFVRYVSAVCY